MSQPTSEILYYRLQSFFFLLCLQCTPHQIETDFNWLKNQVKVVGEREILASLVEFKHHSMAETIRNEK